MSDRVTRHDTDGLCTLMLNRPDKLNALDTPAFEDLDAHLAALEGEMDRVGCVVLRGAGRGFCAGADQDGRSGMQAAKRMMMTARLVAATEAAHIGLVDLLAPEGGLDELAPSLATEVLANSWHTNFAAKRLLRETERMTLAEGLAHEHYRHPGHAADCQDRIARFRQK